ncbi:MAG: hypothetical protein R3E95_02255 [Thiolinea sp.]
MMGIGLLLLGLLSGCTRLQIPEGQEQVRPDTVQSALSAQQ